MILLKKLQPRYVHHPHQSKNRDEQRSFKKNYNLKIRTNHTNLKIGMNNDPFKKTTT